MGTATPSSEDQPTTSRLARAAVTTLAAIGAAAIAVRMLSRRRIAGVSTRPSRRKGQPAQPLGGAAMAPASDIALAERNDRYAG